MISDRLADWVAPYGSPVAMFVMAGLVGLLAKRPRLVLPLAAAGWVGCGWRLAEAATRDDWTRQPAFLDQLPSPPLGVAVFLAPLLIGPALLAARASVPATLLMWSGLLADPIGTVPAIAWLAAGRDDAPDPADSDRAGRSLLRVVVIAVAFLLLTGPAAVTARPVVGQIAVTWLGLLIVLDVWPDPQVPLPRRLGSACLGTQTLLAVATTVDVPARFGVPVLLPIMLTPIALALFGLAAIVRSTLAESIVPAAGGLLVTVPMAVELLPPDPTAAAVYLVIAVAVTVAAAAAVIGRELARPVRVAIAAVVLPILPTGVFWWLGLGRLLLVRQTGPSMPNDEPSNVSLLIALLALLGPLTLVPAIWREWTTIETTDQAADHR